MTEEQMVSAFGEATVEHIKDGIMMGLEPVYIGEVMILGGFRLVQDYKGSAFAIASLERALECLRKEAAGG